MFKECQWPISTPELTRLFKVRDALKVLNDLEYDLKDDDGFNIQWQLHFIEKKINEIANGE